MTNITVADDLTSPQTPVCAIGASAGGVTALRNFFSHISPDLGAAYVVIVHLAPEQPSVLSEILAAVTVMPVEAVLDESRLKPNSVYVIPPDRELVIQGDEIKARRFSEPRGRRYPIDLCFESIAAARADGVAIVLSGSGSDGANGARAVKQAGGVVFVQDPDEAEFSMMPHNAISAGVVDFIGPVAEITTRLADALRGGENLRQMDKGEQEQNLAAILAFLRTRVGHDFSSYKQATVLRRISRRMQLVRRSDMESYYRYLVEQPDEAQALLADLLISVTTFFRDADSFAALAQNAIGPILDGLQGTGPIRVWVVGCATGEEAYSIGMLLLEEAERRGAHPSIQIFASDIDENALAVAREGRYPGSIRAQLSEERLARFFVVEGDDYHVRKELRDLVLFVSHSALKDPPFIKLDLIACRNVLIYLQRELQRQLLSLFQYAIKPSGFLFLGSAETVEIAPSVFRPLDREARIFAPLPLGQKVAPMLPQLAFGRHVQAIIGAPPAGREPSPGAKQAHAAALEFAAPPSLLVDEGGRIVHLSAKAGRFLSAPEGVFTSDLSTQIRPELRVDLKLALQAALEKGQSTLTRPVSVAFNGHSRMTALHVAPASERSGQALVAFLDGGEAPVSETPRGDDDINRDEVVHLREELTAAQDRLNASRKEQEEATQELLGANEELQSINEEYRSTAEELETSKEELQSLNEELQTLNAELRSKLESISAAHNDLENLISATDLATIFLDGELRIRMFTPAVAKYFSIVDNDVGRAIDDFTRKLDYPELEQDAAEVLRSLVPIEREITVTDGGWLQSRVRPYRTLDHRINGLVLTFADISRLKRVEKDLAEEMEARSRLQDLSTIVYESGELAETLSQMLDVAFGLLGADFGMIQLLDEKSGTLRIVAQRGYQPRFLDHFSEVGAGEGTACGMTLAAGSAMAFGDIETEPALAAGREEFRAAGVRAIISAPLRGTTGGAVGVLSLHFRTPRTFVDRDKRLAQVCALRVADVVNSHQLRQEILAANRRKDEFLATLAHELRNPLASIANAVEVQMRPGLAGLTRSQAEQLHAMMARQVSHLRRLVDDLMDVSRIAQGKIEMRRRIVDLNAIVRDAAETAALSFGDKRNLRLSLSHDELNVDGDPVRLAQAFGNVLSNAVKYTPPGGAIEVVARRDGDFAVASVRDHGDGISPEALPHIFELFFQGDHHDDQPADGVGIGLSLAQKIVALHGGALSAKSDGPGKGSEFVMRLPLAAAPAPASHEPPPEAPVESSRRVLVVDDNHDVADTFAMALENIAADVRVAYGGDEALACIPEFRPDIVFLDLGMPKMDGYETARRIRKLPEGAGAILVALSGWDRDEDRKRSVEAGFDRHMAKQVKPEDLKAVLAWRIPGRGDGAANEER